MAESQPLPAWLATSPSVDEVLDAIVQVGTALAAAHGRGELHLRLVAEDVHLDEAGGVTIDGLGNGTPSEEVAPEDSLLERAGAERIPRVTSVAPEEAVGLASSAASDQFAFSVLAWDAIFGTPPFAVDDDDAATLRNAIEGQRRETAEDAPRLARVRRALQRGMDAEPSKRWAEVAALVKELERGRPGAVAESPSPSQTPKRRMPFELVLGVGAIALVAISQGRSDASEDGPDEPATETASVEEEVAAPIAEQGAPAAEAPASASEESSSETPAAPSSDSPADSNARPPAPEAMLAAPEETVVMELKVQLALADKLLERGETRDAVDTLETTYYRARRARSVRVALSAATRRGELAMEGSTERDRALSEVWAELARTEAALLSESEASGEAELLERVDGLPGAPAGTEPTAAVPEP